MSLGVGGDFSKFFLNPEHSDIRLRIRDGEESKVFPAHCFVLKAKSRVFKILIENGKFDENGSPPVSDLAVEGGVLVALAFVKYFYTGQISTQSLQDSLHLLKAARDYQTTELTELCQAKIQAVLSPDNVNSVFMFLQKIPIPDLHNKCLELMIRCAFILFRDNVHLTWDEDTMKSVLESSALNVLSEEQALEALWQWGKWKCFQVKKRCTALSIKRIVTNLLPHIRWNQLEGSQERIGFDSKWKPAEFESSEREPAAYPAMLQFASKLRLIDCETRVAPRIVGPYTPPNLQSDMLSFSLDQDVLLAGIEVHLYMLREVYENIDDHISFFLDKQVITTKGSKQNFLNFEHWYGNDYYSRSVTVEFKKLVLLQKIKHHKFELVKKCHPASFSYPVYELIDNPFDLTVGSVSSKMFIHGDIVCLTALYFFQP